MDMTYIALQSPVFLIYFFFIHLISLNPSHLALDWLKIH